MNLAWSYRPAREPRWPAYLAAVVLHVLLVLAVVYLGRSTLKPMGTSVPINIVATGPVTDSRAAEQAPEAQPAATENPVPDTPPAPPPPAPKVQAPPVPAPPKPTPPKPVPTKAVPIKPAPPPPTPVAKPTHPAKPQPAPAPAPAFDLDKLQSSISKYAKPSPPRPAGGVRGPAHAETAPQARPAVANGLSTSDIEGLGQLLNRLWNPNCGANPVDLDVKIAVDQNGRVRVDTEGKENSPDSAIAASAIRAKSAVHKVEPYDPKYRGQAFTIKFDAQKACANR